MALEFRSDSSRLLSLGAVLLVSATGLLLRELAVPIEVVPAAVVLAGLGCALAPRPLLARVGVGALTVGTAVTGAWYLTSHAPWLVAAACVSLLASVALLALTWRRARLWKDEPLELATPMAASGLFVTSSWLLYFHVFTNGLASDVEARRPVLTLAWMLVGLALLVFGHRRREVSLRFAAALPLVAAIGKACFYDTLHLDGLTRIAALALAGVALVGGGLLVRPRAQAEG